MSKKNILVSISALAALAVPCHSAYGQQLKISCKQILDIGKNIASGCANGTYLIRPNGVNSDAGCLVIRSPAMAGSCTIKTVGPLATKSAVIKFTKNTYTITNGSKTVTLKHLRMRSRSGTTSVTRITAPTTKLQNTVTIDIGGSLFYQGGQTSGTYSGNVKIIVDFKS